MKINRINNYISSNSNASGGGAGGGGAGGGDAFDLTSSDPIEVVPIV